MVTKKKRFCGTISKLYCPHSRPRCQKNNLLRDSGPRVRALARRVQRRGWRKTFDWASFPPPCSPKSPFHSLSCRRPGKTVDPTGWPGRRWQTVASRLVTIVAYSESPWTTAQSNISHISWTFDSWPLNTHVYSRVNSYGNVTPLTVGLSGCSVNSVSPVTLTLSPLQILPPKKTCKTNERSAF